jgi:hypothetical protein
MAPIGNPQLFSFGKFDKMLACNQYIYIYIYIYIYNYRSTHFA